MQDVLVCSLFHGEADPVVPGSVKRGCSQCQRVVWVSPSGVAVQTRTRSRLLCLPCAQEEIAGSPDVELVGQVEPETAAELAVELRRRRGGS